MENKKPAVIRFAPKKNYIFLFLHIFMTFAFPVAIPLFMVEHINISPYAYFPAVLHILRENVFRLNGFGRIRYNGVNFL